MKKHLAVGVGAAGLLVLLYAGIITAAQGLEHALEQAAGLWYWMLPIVVGFGTQVGLLSFIRQRLRDRRTSGAATVAASGGVSTGSMLVCCVHHLSELLPIIGLSGVAGLLSSYQTFFFVAAILSNIVGITVMLETIQSQSLCPVREHLGIWVCPLH